MNRGQASIEYMFLLGVSLVLIGILWTVSGDNIQNAQWELSLASASSAAEKIVKTADEVYVQGPPAQTYINVELPAGVNGVYFAGNAVLIELYGGGFFHNVSDYAIVNMTGFVNSAQGRHRLLVKSGNPVNISEG